MTFTRLESTLSLILLLVASYGLSCSARSAAPVAPERFACAPDVDFEWVTQGWEIVDGNTRHLLARRDVEAVYKDTLVCQWLGDSSPGRFRGLQQWYRYR